MTIVDPRIHLHRRPEHDRPRHGDLPLHGDHGPGPDRVGLPDRAVRPPPRRHRAGRRRRGRGLRRGQSLAPRDGRRSCDTWPTWATPRSASASTSARRPSRPISTARARTRPRIGGRQPRRRRRGPGRPGHRRPGRGRRRQRRRDQGHDVADGQTVVGVPARPLDAGPRERARRRSGAGPSSAMNEVPMIRVPARSGARPRHLAADPEISNSPTPKTITDEGSGTDWAATPPMIWSTCVVGWTVSQKRKPSRWNPWRSGVR